VDQPGPVFRAAQKLRRHRAAVRRPAGAATGLGRVRHAIRARWRTRAAPLSGIPLSGYGCARGEVATSPVGRPGRAVAAGDTVPTWPPGPSTSVGNGTATGGAPVYPLTRVTPQGTGRGSWPGTGR